ncbi:hypothetical protein [Cutibacterium sp. V970]|uniref:hypothetical protein n=1 Tax=Cutibacterium sp. V970 TaxID=3446481 RepID=UPI003EE12D1D
MRSLYCDLETYSPVNLAKSGVYPYAADPEFELLLFGYSIDSGDVHVIDLASGQQLPDEVLAVLVDPGVVKGVITPPSSGLHSRRGCAATTQTSSLRSFLIRRSGAARWCGRLTSGCR